MSQQNMHQDFFDILHKDHEEVDGIFRQMERAEARERKEHLEHLREEIIPHMKAEESAFYPRLLEKSEARKDAQEGIKEHMEAEESLQKLTGISTGSAEWKTQLADLKEKVEHHVEEEEGKIFDHARKVLTEAQMRAVIAQFNGDKERIKGSLARVK